MLKIRRSRDCLIFKMGIPIHGKDSLYIEPGPRVLVVRELRLAGSSLMLCNMAGS